MVLRQRLLCYGLFFMTSLAQAWSSTIYSTNAIYVQLEDGTLLRCNVTADSGKSLSISEISSGLTTIASPPSNASLIEGPNGLFAASKGTYSATCGKTPLTIYKYESDTDSWSSLATSNPSSDKVFYLDDAAVWSVNAGEMIYIYGGQCNNKAYSSLFAFNLTSKEFSSPDAGTSPAALYSASVAKVSNNTSVLVGGRSNAGWIGMNQLALWETSSWTFTTATNYSDIDSRTQSLIVPSSWDPSSTKASDNDISLLVIGGVVSGRASTPYISMLTASAEGWKWTSASDSSDASQQVSDGIVGAFTLYDALILLTSDSSLSSRDLSSGLKLQAYNAKDGFSSLSKVSIPTVSSAVASTATETVTGQGSTATATATATSTLKPTATPSPTSSSSSGGLSVGGIAALSTVLPLLLLAVCIGLGIFFMRRRKRRQLVLYTKSPASSVRGFGEYFEDPNPNPWYSPADGDEKSINSWNERRAQYEHQRGESRISVESVENQVPNVVYDQPNAGLPRPHSAMTTRSPEVVKPLRTSYSLSSHRSHGGPFQDHYSAAPPQQHYRPEPATHYEEEDSNEFFQDRDVQVLVSSRRRTRLVIANPDEVDEEQETQDNTYNTHQVHEHTEELVTVKTNMSEVSKGSESSGSSADSATALLPQDNSSSSSIARRVDSGEDKKPGSGIHRRTRSDLAGGSIGAKPKSRAVSGSLRYN